MLQYKIPISSYLAYTILQYKISSVSQHSTFQVYCIAIQFPAIQCLAYLLSHNTLYCIVIQPAFTSLQYNLYCNTKTLKLASPSSPLSYNTIGTLQYKFFFSHNIVWVVAQKRFLHQIFFFFSFFISTHSNYWKILKKHLYTFFFLSFPHTQINL